jgi:hypothetical protein
MNEHQEREQLKMVMDMVVDINQSYRVRDRNDRIRLQIMGWDSKAKHFSYSGIIQSFKFSDTELAKK